MALVLVEGSTDGSTTSSRPGRPPRRRAVLCRLLEGEIVPESYDRDAAGLPIAWIQRMKRSMRTLVTAFSATRMVSEYEQNI